MRPQISGIGIGNLTAGGTGKTPMAEWILQHAADPARTALISRGYGRKTKGLLLAEPKLGSAQIGDEPAQIRSRFPELTIVLSEKRTEAVNYIQEKIKNIDLLLFDDVYQHRYVDPQLKILLCDYRRPYFRDYPIPAGRLREFRCGAARADIIVVTRCPDGFSESDKNQWEYWISPGPQQQVLFATQDFAALIAANEAARNSGEARPDTAFSGIARADSFEQHLRDKHGIRNFLRFGDHHNYSSADLEKILAAAKSGIVTTAKDLARLDGNNSFAEQIPLWVLPVSHRFLFGGGELLKQRVAQLTGRPS